VIDDHAANRHRFTVSTPALGSLLSEAARLLETFARDVMADPDAVIPDLRHA
jgi:hypothetical protein